MPETITLDPPALEIARRGAMAAVLHDLEFTARHLRDLHEAAWPADFPTASDPREDFEVLRRSMATIEALGWPDTADREAG
jgi:hypothetical protein